MFIRSERGLMQTEYLPAYQELPDGWHQRNSLLQSSYIIPSGKLQ